jgi:NADPH:quinone reductase-like Zn-dependent oxidoreductase
VTGVCSTKSLDLVRSIGADHVIDYTQEDFTRSGQRYDLILEMAGNRSLADLRRALTPKGTLVLVGGSGGKWFRAPVALSERLCCHCSRASGCARSSPSQGERIWLS